MQAGRGSGRDNHKRFSFLVVVFTVLLFVANIFIFGQIFSAINISFENTAASPCSPRVLLSMFIEAAVSGVTPRCVPCIRAGLRCCAGPCVMRPVLLLLHTILAVDTTAGHEGPPSFHNHGEGPYYLA